MAAQVTQAEFARHRGVSRKTVTKWKADGLLSMTPDGLVKVEESEWLLADRPGSYRGGTTKSAKSEAPARIATPAPAPQPDETPEETADRVVHREGSAPYAHAEAVRIKENYLALLRRLEFDLKSGAVVPIDVVIAVLVEQLAKVRNKVLGIGVRVAPRAAVLKSAQEIKALFDAEAALALEELTLDGGSDDLDELRAILQQRFGSVH
ncbi:hypothetical protein OMR07_05625 [Methylobacterium organophilum]|nr:hypothetical protein [Methylobacterium organophilum]